MSLRLLCFILAFLQVYSVNYQDRCIYYNEHDNVCHVTLDLILLRINIDGIQTVTHTAWGETICRDGEIYYWKIVIPSKRFGDADDGFDISFAQVTRNVYTFECFSRSSKGQRSSKPRFATSLTIARSLEMETSKCLRPTKISSKHIQVPFILFSFTFWMKNPEHTNCPTLTKQLCTCRSHLRDSRRDKKKILVRYGRLCMIFADRHQQISKPTGGARSKILQHS